MAGSRRRRLSSEERALWEQVAASAIPLHPGRPAAALPEATHPPMSGEPVAPHVPAPLPRPVVKPKTGSDPAADPRVKSTSGHPRMDERRFEKLRRGRLEPEDRLDLHGMTSGRAHSVLTGFVLGAHARGLRLVLVITGKGRPDESAMAAQRCGILRHSVPHWLATPPLTAVALEVVPAHRRHGGSGAYYIYLRRRR